MAVQCRMNQWYDGPIILNEGVDCVMVNEGEVQDRSDAG